MQGIRGEVRSEPKELTLPALSSVHFSTGLGNLDTRITPKKMTLFLYTFLWYTFLLFLLSFQSNIFTALFGLFCPYSSSISFFRGISHRILFYFCFQFSLLELYLYNKYLSISHLQKYHARITQLASSRSLFSLHRLIASTVSISYKFTR